MNRVEFDQVNLLGAYMPNKKYIKYLIGDSFLNLLTKSGESPIIHGSMTFGPGCRSNWHIHHGASGSGQILVCTAGEGWYQEEGKEAVSLLPGTVIVTSAEVKHWHGAKADSWFTHIVVDGQGEKVSEQWYEPVSDEVYSSLK